MTKCLRATFENLHPRSGRFYDAETNRYFALSNQAGDYGKRVDSDSQQFWEFYQLCFGALQGELDEAMAQVATMRAKAIEIRQLLYEYNNSFMSSHEYDAKLKPLVNNLIDLALTDSSTAKAHDKSIWDEAIEAAAHQAEIWDSEPLSGKSIAQEIRALIVTTDKNGSGE